METDLAAIKAKPKLVRTFIRAPSVVYAKDYAVTAEIRHAHGFLSR